MWSLQKNQQFIWSWAMNFLESLSQVRYLQFRTLPNLPNSVILLEVHHPGVDQIFRKSFRNCPEALQICQKKLEFFRYHIECQNLLELSDRTRDAKNLLRNLQLLKLSVILRLSMTSTLVRNSMKVLPVYRKFPELKCPYWFVRHCASNSLNLPDVWRGFQKLYELPRSSPSLSEVNKVS